MRKSRVTTYRLAATLALAVVAGEKSVRAAVILNNSSGPTATASTTYNYNSLGTQDFAFFGDSATSPDHSASVGTSLFSALSTVGGGAFGGGGDAQSLVTFTNGTPTASVTASAKFSYNSGFALGNGESFAFTFASTAETLKVFAVSYDARETLTVTSGVNTLYTDSNDALPSPDGTGGSGHGYGLYTFNLSGAVGDSVTVSIVDSTNEGGSPNVGLQGATAAPEPASLSLLALGAVGLLSRRRVRIAP